MNEFSGNIKSDFYEKTFEDRNKPLPQLPPLPSTDYPKDNKGFVVGFLAALFIIGLLIIAGVFVYYVKNGAFKSSVSQAVNFEPQINNTVNNEYDNIFNNNVDFNVTIIIENIHITCSSGGCNGTG